MIMNGIWLGHMYSRNILITGFLKDFTQSRTEMIGIEEILDIPHFNQFILQNGWNTKIDTNLTQLPTIKECTVEYITEKKSFFYNLME